MSVKAQIFPQQAQLQTRQVTMTGRIVHQPGPWGSKRPVRTFADIDVKVRDPQTKLIGYVGHGKSHVNGLFLITTDPINALMASDMFLEINDLSKTHTYQLIPGPLNLVSIFPQDLGDIIVPWAPLYKELARVNSTAFEDTQSLARKLCQLLKSPAYPTSITLIRESGTSTSKFNWATRTEWIFYGLMQESLPKDFPARIVEQLWDESIRTKSDTSSSAIVTILERLSRVDIKDLETGTLLNPLLAALQRASLSDNFSYSEKAMEDAATDMAAACVLLFVAGLMAKDKVKPKVQFRPIQSAHRTFNETRQVLETEISITR